MTPEIRTPVSVDEFWRLAHRFPRAELVGGQVIELVPPGLRHGVLVAALSHALFSHVTAHGLGVVTTDSGFVLDDRAPTVRAPDIAVILAGRAAKPPTPRFAWGAPDLAVEVLSPEDRAAETAARIADYLRAGAAAVWIVDPAAQNLAVHTRLGVVEYARTETLTGAPPLPTLDLPLDRLFAHAD